MNRTIWLLLLAGWIQECSFYFFNIPERGEFKIYADENYVDYIKKRDSISNPVCSGTLTFTDVAGTITVSEVGSKKKLTLSGTEAPTLQKVFDVCFAGLQITNSDLFDGTKTKFKYCEVDTTTKQAKCEGKVDEIKLADKFTVSPANLEFEWVENGQTDRFNLEKIAVDIKGDINIIDEMAFFEANKAVGSSKFIITKFDGKSISPNLNIIAYMNGIDSDIDETALAAESQDLNYGLFARIVWGRGFTGVGCFYADNRFQVMFSSREPISNTRPFNETETTQNVFVAGDTAGNVKAALLAEFKATEPLGEVINELFTSSTTSFKMVLNRVHDRKWCACFSKELIKFDISYLRDTFKTHLEGCFPNEIKEEQSKIKLMAGVSIKISVDLKGNMTKCYADHPVEDQQKMKEILDKIPRPVTLTCVKKLINGFSCSFPKNVTLPIGMYLGCATGEDDFFGLPPNILGLGNNGFITDAYAAPVDGNLDCRFNFRITPKDVFIPTTNLKLENVDFTFEREGGEITAAISAEVNSQGTDFSTLIRCENKGDFKTYQCTIAMPSFTLEDLLGDIFGIEDFGEPDDIFNKEAILKSGVKDLVIIYTWGTEESYVRIRGELRLLDLEGLIMEILILKEGGFAFGLYATSLDFEGLINKFQSNSSKVSLPWLSNMEGKLYYSNFQGAEEEADEEEEDEPSKKKTSRSRRSVAVSNGKQNLKKLTSLTKSATLKKGRKQQRANLKKKISVKQSQKRAKLHRRADFTHVSSGGHIYRAMDTSEIQFESPSFAGFEIKPGFGFEFVWKSPKTKEGCYKDSCCEFLYDKIGETSLTLGGVFSNDGTWILTAAIGAAIPLVDHLVLEGVSLEMTWGPELDDRSIMFKAELVYSNPEVYVNPLRFSGSVLFTLSGSFSVEFAMLNMINEPWGTKDFAIGDLMIGGELDISAASITLILSGQVHIGPVKTVKAENFDKEILSFTMAFGIDPANPANCWIYAKANTLTMGKLCTVFGCLKHIPEDRLGDGFPEGILFSFAKEEQYIEAIGLDVSEGLRINGKFKFWDFAGSADLTLKPASMEYDINLELEAINWCDGQIAITSVENATVGPHMKVVAEPDTFSVDIDGRIYIFGLEYKCQVKMGGAEILIAFSGPVFPGIFTASFRIKGTVGIGGKFDGVEVTIGFETNDLFKKMKEYLLGFLTTTQDAAKEACVIADKVIAVAEADEGTATKETAILEKDINTWKQSLKDREDELKKKQESSESIEDCKKKCVQVCFPFGDWNSECYTVWGKWCGCPFWNSCFSMIDDLICLGGCVVNAVKNAFVTWVESTMNKIAMAMTTVATALSNVVEGVVDAAKKLGELAVALKDLVVAGIKKIAEFALSAINFNIRKLELKATLSPKFRLCFNYWIDVDLFGSKYESKYENELCLDDIVKYIIDGICSFVESLKAFLGFPKAAEQVKGQSEGVGSATSELTESKTTSEQEVEMQTAESFNDELEERSKLPRPEMFHFINKLRSKYNNSYSDEHRAYLHTSHRMESYEIQDPELATAYETNAPWIHSANYDMLSNNFKPTDDKTAQFVSKRSYIEGENLTPCGRMKRSLSNYADISNKLSKSMSNVREMKHHIKITRRDNIAKLAKFYQQTHEIGTKYEDMNEQQRSDIYHWYNKISKGYKKHAVQTKRHFIQHNHNALPILRSQINYALKHNFNTSFEHMIGDMHKNAVESYKRSVIPTPQGVEGEKVLHYIKDNLFEIVTNEDAPITHFQGKLNNVNAAIREMNKYTMQCQNNVSK